MEVRLFAKNELYKGRAYPLSLSTISNLLEDIPSPYFMSVWFANWKDNPDRRSRAKHFKPERNSRNDVLNLRYTPPVAVSVKKGKSLDDEGSDTTPCHLRVQAVDMVVLQKVKDSLENGGLLKIKDWLTETLRKEDSLRRFEMIVTCDGKSVDYLIFEI